MDFLDPKKQKAHAIRIWIGYFLIGTALLLATTILLYQAYGFRINRQGEVIQNGLVFVSSTPADAAIYANGKSLGETTNARLTLTAGQYTFELKREGYNIWKRGITVEGGSVQRFLYPFLFPVDLRSDSLKAYEKQPTLMTQSPNRQWLLVHANAETFDLFDLSQADPAAQSRTVPAEVVSADTATVSWREVQWSDDNRHVVLKRVFTKNGQQSSEYVLYDTEEPEKSRNLTTHIGFSPTELVLRDGKFDSYYAFDKNSGVLFTATMDEPTPQPLLRDVLEFEADGEDTLVYATAKGAPKNKVLMRLYQDDTSYTIREAPAGKTYLIQVAHFGGAQIVVAGASNENRVFVYRSPLDSLRDEQVVVPVQILKVNRPTQLSFSENARFVAAQRGGSFAVYDAETDRGYAYDIDLPKNTSPSAATWMDGHRLTVVNDKKVIVFDFDGTNQYTLVPGQKGFVPVFGPDYTTMYTMSPDKALTSTSLRTPQDQ